MTSVVAAKSANVGDTYKIGSEILEVKNIRHVYEPDGIDEGYNDYIFTFTNGSVKRMKADDKLTPYTAFTGVRFFKGGKRKSRCKRSKKSRKYRRKSIRCR